MMFGYYKITFMCSVFIVYVVSTTHWVITEKGLIQPRKYSPFNLRRPYDLINFLDQHDRRTEIITRTIELARIKEHVENKWAIIDGTFDVETRLYNHDVNCIAAGMKLSEVDLFSSVVLDGADIKFIDQSALPSFVEELLKLEKNHREPDCRKNFNLSFSMFAYEHLSAMVHRRNLSMKPEMGLYDIVLPEMKYLRSYGNQIYTHLQSNSSSWLHYNMAVLFWRMKGNALKAMECARRAVYFSPRYFRDIALLTMGGILHNTNNPNDAAIVLQAAIDHSPNKGIHYLALGNVYTSIAEYNKSILCYEKCIKLDGDLHTAKLGRHAVLCHQKVVKKLVNLLESLKLLASDLHDFWRTLDMIEGAHDEALKFASFIDAPNADEIYSNFDFKDCNYDFGIELNPEICHARNSVFKLNRNILNSILENFQYISSEVQHKVKKITKKMENSVNLNGQKSNRQHVAQIIFKKNIFGDKTRVDSSEDKPTEIHVKIEQDGIIEKKDSAIEFKNKPGGSPLPEHKANPPKVSMKKFLEGKHKYPYTKSEHYNSDFAPGWPLVDECIRWKDKFPVEDNNYIDPSLVVIPLENKGLNLDLYLSDYIGVPASEQYPLPWYSPICCRHDEKIIEKNYVPGTFKSRNIYKELPPDEMSRQLLLYYVTNGNIKVAEHMTIEEIGQRIITLIGMDLLPPWVASWLSVLYWSARGGPHAARNILTCALCCLVAPVPDHIRDLALVPIGSILHLIGQYDEAATSATEARMLNPREPSIYYLTSLTYRSMNNSDMAIFFMKLAVRMDYNFRDGLALTLLKKWSCEPRLAAYYESSSKDSETTKRHQMICTLKVEKKKSIKDVKTTDQIKKGTNNHILKENVKINEDSKHPIEKVTKHPTFVLQVDVPNSKNTDHLKEITKAINDNIKFIEENVLPLKNNAKGHNTNHIHESVQPTDKYNQKPIIENIEVVMDDVKAMEAIKDIMRMENIKAFDALVENEKHKKVNDEATCKKEKTDDTHPFQPHCGHDDKDIKEVKKPYYKYIHEGEPTISKDPAYPEVNMTEFFCNIVEESCLRNMEAILQENERNAFSTNVKLQGSCEDIKSLFVWPSSDEIYTMLTKRGVEFANELGRFGVPDDKGQSPTCPSVIIQFPVKIFLDDTIKLFPALTKTISHSEVPIMEDLVRVLTRRPTMRIADIALLITNSLNMNALFWPGSAIAAIYWRSIRQPKMYMACVWSALALAPKHHKDILILAVAVQLQREGYYSEALDLAKLAFRMEPRSPWNGYVVGLLFAVQGDYASAKRLFKYVLSFDEETTRAKEALAISECTTRLVNARKR